MKKISILFFFLISFAYSFAQSNYVKGSIVTNDNDTIGGYIDFRTDRLNAQECKFRKTKTSEDRYLYPQDLIGYMIEDAGKRYVSREITIDGVNRRVFAEYLVKGVMNLYSYLNAKGETYYIFDDPDKEPVVITKGESITVDRMDKPDVRYKGVLKYHFGKYAPSSNNLKRIDFDQKSMIEITKEYHNAVCTTGEECIVFENKNPDKSFTETRFSIYAGIKFLDFIFDKDHFRHSQSLNHVVPTIGAQVDFTAPRWNKNLSLLLNLSFSYLQFEHTEKIPQYTETLKYSTLYATLGVGAKYTHRSSKIKPSIEIGMPLSLCFNKNADSALDYNHGLLDTKYKKVWLNDFSLGFYSAVGLQCPVSEKYAILLNAGYEYNILYRGIDINNKLKGFFVKTGFVF